MHYDKMEEECGVFAISSLNPNNDLASLVYYGLYALQHRGQESAGIAMCNTQFKTKEKHNLIKNMGLVSEVFSVDNLKNYNSNIVIGHTRYSITGESNINNCQPLNGYSILGDVSLAHNGNLIKTQKIKEELLQAGSLFQTTTDTEIILKLFSKNLKYGIKQAIINTFNNISGSFALIMIVDNKLVAIRDAQGIRPLSLGMKDNDYIVSSETCAIDTIGGKVIRDIEPGECVIIENNNIESFRFAEKSVKATCLFEYIYFARPDSVIDSIDVYSFRHESGRFLYQQNPIEADIVIGVPDSGVPAAIGYSEISGIPYGIGLVKNKYIGRSFIAPTQELREILVKVKLNPISHVVKGKRVVVVDDSLVRGTTSKKIIKMLKDAGAKEVHFRLASPIVKKECYFGINISNEKELIGSHKSIEEIRKEIEADSLDYLSLDSIITILKDHDFCTGCFTGNYPLNNNE